mmetsp:Transcript_10846/g.25146  ORF Transcript_10846/g.25146 Transcript_10846/m.25146 type:complete len:165 (+) Transcript_10846:197-691(+)
MAKETVEYEIKWSKFQVASREKMELTVVFDKASAKRDFVRGLLNGWSEFAQKKFKEAFEEWGSMKKVELVVCGTGRDPMDNADSDQNNYTRISTSVEVNAASRLRERLIKRAHGKIKIMDFEDLGKTLGPMVHAVAENIRALVVLLQEVEEAGGDGEILLRDSG